MLQKKIFFLINIKRDTLYMSNVCEAPIVEQW